MIQSLKHACVSCKQQSEEELFKRLDEAIDSYFEVPGSLIPILQIAQGIFGYLPQNVLRHISQRLNKPFAEVAGVVSFYSFFSTKPRGKYTIRVCLGTACYVRGGMELLKSLQKELGIDVGETTEDRVFSLEVGRCFGACGMAPVIMVNDDIHQRMKPSKVPHILEQYRSELSENKET